MQVDVFWVIIIFLIGGPIVNVYGNESECGMGWFVVTVGCWIAAIALLVGRFLF